MIKDLLNSSTKKILLKARLKFKKNLTSSKYVVIPLAEVYRCCSQTTQ